MFRERKKREKKNRRTVAFFLFYFEMSFLASYTHIETGHRIQDSHINSWVRADILGYAVPSPNCKFNRFTERAVSSALFPSIYLQGSKFTEWPWHHKRYFSETIIHMKHKIHLNNVHRLVPDSQKTHIKPTGTLWELQENKHTEWAQNCFHWEAQ
jgi:hypothetical protein